jgi:serine/threonine protein kinase
MPLTLAQVLDQAQSPLPYPLTRQIFTSLFRALAHLHRQGIIHRDVKPSAILLSSTSAATINTTANTPVSENLQLYLSDFGTAYHPTLNPTSGDETDSHKVLDVGTGPYRAPECLFGNRAYTYAVDLWAGGCVLAECVARPRPKPLFDSPPAYEDGNQLGLILSIFQTIGSPTPDTWPEAKGFRTPPFDMYRVFEGKGGWEVVLPGVKAEWRDLVAGLVRYESGERVKAWEVSFGCLC